MRKQSAGRGHGRATPDWPHETANGECDAEHRTMLDGADGARRSGRREFCLRRADQRRFLPAGLLLAAAAAQERRLLRNAGGGRGGRVSPMQALPALRRLLCRAARGGDRPGLRADPRPRHTAEPCRAGRGGGYQPLSFPSRLQADHRRDTARMGQGASPRPLRRASRWRRERGRIGLRRGVRRQLAGLRGGAERAWHDPGDPPPRRQGRDDPLYDRADPARPRDRRRHGARHLHDRTRRRSVDFSKPSCGGVSRRRPSPPRTRR